MEISLEDMIYGDEVNIIFVLKKDEPRWQKRALVFTTEFTDIIFYKDIINYIEEEYKDEIEYAILICETGLSGLVLKYNNYGNKELIECGTTRGYA